MWYDDYREYVPVHQRIENARDVAEEVAAEDGRDPAPVAISGTKIARTFWGKAWCEHLEGMGDYANRLPRGRTYVRNGSVVDLQIEAGRVQAIVAGTDVYSVSIDIDPLRKQDWQKIRCDCSSAIDSLLDLLSGTFSDGGMERLTDPEEGMFPDSGEIRMECDCPDSAGICKHIAAVFYGVGARLDQQPELLFVLRGVDHHELVAEAVSEDNLKAELDSASGDLHGEDLEALFGIELDTLAEEPASTSSAGRGPKKTAKKKPAKKRSGSVGGRKGKQATSAARKAKPGKKKTAKKKKTTGAKAASGKKAAKKKKTVKKKAAKTNKSTSGMRASPRKI